MLHRRFSIFRAAPVLALAWAGAAAARIPEASAGPKISAQETAAWAEMANLRDALDMAYLDTGYYVSLEDLDDVGFPTNPAHNDIHNGGGTWVVRLEKGVFNASKADLRFLWFGPHISYQQGRTQIGTSPYDEGSPLDPWGTPYLFFSPVGLIRGAAGTVTNEFYGDQFDRYAFVSFGPDRMQSSDDLILLFGSGVTGPVLSSISGGLVTMQHSPLKTVFITPELQTLTLRGYGFGASRGSSKVFFGSTELTGIAGWSDTEIIVVMQAGLSGENDVRVHLGGVPGNPQTLRIRPNSANVWDLYE